LTPFNVVNGEKPREIAASVLARRRAGGEFTETLLERALAVASLSSADRGLCHELVFGVVRWQATLDWLIAQKTQGRPQKPGLQDLLRLGLYQIFWLDRIPDHAAVHETVEMAKRAGFGPQSGFVNAVLRGFLRESAATKALLADLRRGEENPETEDSSVKTLNARLAIGWSQPEWLVARWRERWGEDRLRSLLEWNNAPAKVYARVNTLRTDAGKLVEQWRAEDVDYDFLTRDWTGENLVFELKSHPPLTTLESFRQGGFYIQDPGTLLAVRELDPRPGENVLDLCAAPGGKTTFMAQLMNNEGRIIACDLAEARLKLVRENCARLGIACVDVRSVEDVVEGGPAGARPRFDRILVDAPCSNTGVLRRRVDLRWRIQPDEITRLRTTQLSLLRHAALLLKPGGVLVYSTCSLEPEENGEVVNQFLSGGGDFKLERQRELLPFADGVDGAFVARLSKSM
jgi:16S rRNA (cytosine967-C5)-methyltransferase